jgi:tellurium resistance protein TerD
MKIDEAAEEKEKRKVHCPKCGSIQIQAFQKGFDYGSAAVGGLLVGEIGILAGGIGSKNIELICLKCGNKWKTGK